MSYACAITEDQRDCYQELTNVAMGRAADRLAKLLDTFVRLPVPRVSMIENSDIQMAIQEVGQDGSVSAVCQGFAGSGVVGETLLIFKDTSFANLADMMNYKGPLSRQAELELLMDTASILIGTCIRGIGEQLEIDFNQSHPVILGQHCHTADILRSGNSTWSNTLAIEIHYQLENVNVECDLLLLFTEESVNILNKKIDYLLD